MAPGARTVISFIALAGHCLLPFAWWDERCALLASIEHVLVGCKQWHTGDGARSRVLLIQRVQQHIEADAGGVLWNVATAADALVAFQRAADIEGRKHNRPAAVDLDSFELWFD